MAPDDLPIDSPADDSIKSAETKPLFQKEGRHSVGPEAEVRGGSEQSTDPPIEREKRSEE